jgi:hypothetical protein
MPEHVGHDGVPLRHDGTPFPPDPSQWTDAEREYLNTYWFGHQEHHDHHGDTVAAADVPDVQHPGGMA